MPGVAGGIGPGAGRGFLGFANSWNSRGERDYIRNAERPDEVTLREVLLREWEIVQTAKDGVGACRPLVANPRSAESTTG